MVAYASASMARKRPKPLSVFQLKITLKDVEGPVWRRVQLDSHSTLKSVHLVLNEAMGWNNSHLHEFVFDDRRFSDPEIDDEGTFEDERAVRLDDLVSVGDRFLRVRLRPLIYPAVKNSKSGRQDSNLRSLASDASAIPPSLLPDDEVHLGIEPS